MGDHPTAAAYRAMFDSFNEGDAEAFGSHLAADVVWHTIGGETIHGAEAVAASMSGLADVDFHLDMHDVISNDQHLIALVTATVTAGDKSFQYKTAEIMHVSDDKITERWAFSDDTAAITEFFAGLSG